MSNIRIFQIWSLIFLLLFALRIEVAFAQETTGENIKVIVKDIYQGMTAFDRKFNDKEVQLLELDQKAKDLDSQLGKTKSKGDTAVLRAELLKVTAGMNTANIAQVRLFKGAIKDVLYPSLMNLGDEVNQVGAMGKENWEEFKQYRDSMGTVLKSTAHLALSLERMQATLSWDAASDELQSEALELRSTIRFAHSALHNATGMGGVSGADIHQQAESLGNVFTKLEVLERLLHQEALALKGDLVSEAWASIDNFIGSSQLNIAVNAPETIMTGMYQRPDWVSEFC